MAICLVRVDDRLIHGQVVMTWVRATKANRIVVLDDGVAADPFMTMVCKSLAPTGTSVEIMTLAQAIEKIPLYHENDALRAIILVKTPKPVLELKLAGVKLDKMVIGGMGIREGRTKLYRNISADEQERGMIRQLINMGMEVVCQIVSDDNPVDCKTMV